MIRKQFYVDPHHDYLLKKLARATGTSEAELVRRALEAHLNTGMATGHNPGAWDAERAFIESRIKSSARRFTHLEKAVEPGRGMTSMTAKILVDTNVLVYAYDLSDPKKQTQALKVLDTSGL